MHHLCQGEGRGFESPLPLQGTKLVAAFRHFGFQRGEARQERKIGTDELRVLIIGWASLEGSASGS
jgi:hypothetical protein